MSDILLVLSGIEQETSSSRTFKGTFTYSNAIDDAYIQVPFRVEEIEMTESRLGYSIKLSNIEYNDEVNDVVTVRANSVICEAHPHCDRSQRSALVYVFSLMLAKCSGPLPTEIDARFRPREINNRALGLLRKLSEAINAP